MHKACVTGDSGKLQFYIIFLTHINPENQVYFQKIVSQNQFKMNALYTICKDNSISHDIDMWYLM